MLFCNFFIKDILYKRYFDFLYLNFFTRDILMRKLKWNSLYGVVSAVRSMEKRGQKEAESTNFCVTHFASLRKTEWKHMFASSSPAYQCCTCISFIRFHLYTSYIDETTYMYHPFLLLIIRVHTKPRIRFFQYSQQKDILIIRWYILALLLSCKARVKKK